MYNCLCVSTETTSDFIIVTVFSTLIPEAWSFFFMPCFVLTIFVNRRNDGQSGIYEKVCIIWKVIIFRE